MCDFSKSSAPQHPELSKLTDSLKLKTAVQFNSQYQVEDCMIQRKIFKTKKKNHSRK